MGIWPELKMGPEIVHCGPAKKGPKTRQNDEVRDRFLPDFHEISAKTLKFQGQNACVWPFWLKSVKMADFSHF